MNEVKGVRVIEDAPQYTFACRHYQPGADGGVAFYWLEVISVSTGEAWRIPVKPGEIAVSVSLKRLLLGHRILYLATRAQHNALILKLFEKPPQPV